MAVLLPVHTDFVEWSSYKINGGSVIFTNTTNYFNTRYIDTTHLDLSVFTTTTPYPNYPLNIATFTLTVYLSTGATLILWSETTTNRFIGYTIPKKVYDLGQQLNISYISLTSSYPNIYFELWNQSKAYILISVYLEPVITASVNNLELTYDDTQLPFPIPSTKLLITNSEYYTGNINWYIQKNPTLTPLFNTDIVDNIPELNVYNSTNLTTQILISSNIYYNNNLYIVAVNSEGLMSQTQIHAKIMTYPNIVTQGTYLINLTKNTSYPVSSNITNYSGPVTWNIISNYYSSNISVSDNKNSCIFTTNTYINQNDIIVTAKNQNNNTTSNYVSIMAAYQPQIKTPKKILQTITSNQTYTYNNIYISNNNTGPVIWYLKNDTKGVNIDYNTGALTLTPYINSNVSIVAQNLIGVKSSNTIYINTLPTPYISITNININTVYSNNAYYQLVTRDPSTNIQWNIQPKLIGVQLNSTSGLLTFNSGVYISSNITINALNTLGCNITQNTVLKVATNPIIINPGYQRYNMVNTNYNLQFNLSNNALGTGPITWSIVNSNLYSGMSINSNSGLLTVQQNNPINTSVGIKAQNITNGTHTIYVPLNISQQPIIINPGNKVVNIQQSTIYNLQIYTSNNTYANAYNNLKWYIDNKTNNNSNIFSITSITSSNTSNIGLFSVASNTICNETIYIGACNLTGQLNEIQFNLALSVITDFICPPSIYGSIEPYTNIFTYQFNSLVKNIVSWNVLDTNSNSLAPLLSMNNTGLLTFNANNIQPQINTYNNQLLIVTTNTNNYKTTYNTRLNLELTPLLYVPETITASSTNNTLYQLTATNNAPINNYYLIEPFINGININSNNGLITFTSNIYYGNTIFGVAASNNYGSESRINIPIHIAQQPVLINPGNISCNLDKGQVFNYQILNTAIGTGPLTWFINGYETFDTNIPGLSINNGYLSLETNNAVNNNITISAKNTTNTINESGSIYFNLKIGYTPILIPPPNNILIANTVPRRLYTYQLNQIAIGTGNMYGSISNISDFTSSNISINNTGLITINSNVYINEQNMYTQLSNVTGGYCNIHFGLVAAQIPQFTVSPFIKTTIYESCNLNMNPYIYNINTTSILDATSNVSWNILPSNIKGISYNSYNSYNNIIANCNVSTLEINYNSNIYLNCNISIIATNALGGCNIQNTTVIYATSPSIINPYILSSNIYSYTTNLVYNYKFNINLNTGPLTWNIYPNKSGLNINSSGLLTYNSVNAINSNILISASNLIGVSCNINVLLNITQTPSIINPNNIIHTMYDSNFTYQMTISNKSQCGITTWSLEPPIDNLSINSNTGLITFLKTYIINSNITVFAKNINNISNSVLFNLQVANAPNIVSPTNNQIYASILPDTVFDYNITQSSVNTGELYWNITDLNSNIINGVSISNISTQLANIQVSSNIYINTPVIVSASNIYGAVSRKNINMLITQIPVLINPLNISSNLFDTFNYQISNLVTNIQPYTWYLENIPNYMSSNISINTYGNITVTSNIGFNNNITVGACNILGSYCNISFDLTVTNTPSIVMPTPYSISNLSIGFYDTFNYQMVNSDLRSSSLPLIWSFKNNTYPGLSITNDGLLTLQSAYSICNMPVDIEATNQLGYSNTTSFNMYVLRTPLLIPPEPVSCNIYSDYNYQILSNIESNIIPSVLSWSILSNPLPEALSITSNTGLITFSSNYNINETIYINASNVLGACNIVPFSLNLTPPPVLDSINIIPNSNNALIYLSGKFVSNITINVNNINQENFVYNVSISNTPYNANLNNPYKIDSLLPNTGYNFNIVPYNSLNLQGSLQTSNIVTLPSQLTNINTQITPYNFSLIWENLYGAYTYSQISWSNLYNFTSSNSTDIDATTSNYTLNNLIPNTLYNINVTPYNYSNINGYISQLKVTTLPIVNVYTSNIQANSAIIKWNSISCNNSYNDYLSYSNISINIYGSNVNKTFNFTSNLITSQYVANLDNNTLYTLSTTVYNNANNSNNSYLQSFNTLGSLPKLIVTAPSENIFNISWGAGNYNYVKYTYNNYDGSSNTNRISDSSVTLHITAYYTIYFSVTPYNNEDTAGESSSVYIQNNSGSLAIYYTV